MERTVVVEGCKLVGLCEDMDCGFVLLGCVRSGWPPGGGDNTLGTKTNLPSLKADNKSTRSGKVFRVSETSSESGRR